MAARYARSKGYDDAVMYAQGKVSETSRANLFIVKNKRIITPPLSSCCLYGVMRRQLFKLCFELKVNIRESNLSQKDLLEADEMFLTNSVRGIIPVGSYLSRNYQPGYGPISGFLQQSMERFLLAEIV
jgi:branched-chain amino acid aminotransferase